jgi:DNA ligase-associated metallophosphoesterase
MSVSSLGKAVVAANVVLDGRLALFHKRERWLAIADLHFGYELSQRAAGWLVPLWGMESITDRLLELIDDYRPERLIILGDLVHDRAAAAEARALLERLRRFCELIVVAGNHDRQLKGVIELHDSWQSKKFHFHHGHCVAKQSHRIQIVGHHHPSSTVRDGAGLRLKVPAFIQQERCWILPAFSPWASGTSWPQDEASHVWLCTPQRIVRLSEKGAL